MDSDNNTQDNADSVAALKDLTAELENLKASDLAAEPTTDAAAAGIEPLDSPADTTNEADAPSAEPAVSTEEETAAELSDKPNLEVPTEPIIPDEPVAPEPSTDMPTNADSSIPEDTSADFTNISSEEPSNEESSEEEKKDLPPIKPAAPVPGSIGSARSYEDYQVDEANRASKEANKVAKEANAKKTTNTGLILGIVIAAIAVIIAVIFAIVIITNKPENKVVDFTNVPPEEETMTLSSVTCTKPIKDAELAALGQASKAEATFTATYHDDELYEITEKTVIEYPTVDDANNSAAVLKDAYQSTLELINIEKDPFTSMYPVSGTTLTISHIASAEEIDEKNFALFGLQVDEENKVKTSAEDIEELYTAKDYTCVVE